MSSNANDSVISSKKHASKGEGLETKSEYVTVPQLWRCVYWNVIIGKEKIICHQKNVIRYQKISKDRLPEKGKIVCHINIIEQPVKMKYLHAPLGMRI